MKLSYNSPLILSFALLAVGVYILNHLIPGGIVAAFYFSSPTSFHFNSVLDYVRSVSYILGHGSWNHLTGNLMLILLLGPMLEEKYGFLPFLCMILLTAALTNAVNMFFTSTSLVGASGIVFMMITLSSFTNAQKDAVPLTFILITLLFLSREIADAVFAHDNVSQFGHIFGGICGGVFGFVFPKRS